jgi:hypothetical protein
MTPCWPAREQRACTRHGIPRDRAWGSDRAGLVLSQSDSARSRAAMAAPRLHLISGACAGSASMHASHRTWREFVTAGQSAPRARVDTEDAVDLTAAPL